MLSFSINVNVANVLVIRRGHSELLGLVRRAKLATVVSSIDLFIVLLVMLSSLMT